MSVPLDDRGLLLGDGLFETLLATDGRLVDFEAHARRLDRGCAVLGLPSPGDDQLWAAAEQALAAAGVGQGHAAVRLTWTAGSGGRGLDRPDPPFPRLFASAAAAAPPAGPARLATASARRNADSPASRLKSLAYLDSVLARREAQEMGADEAVMLNTRGEVACAAAANLFWFEGERLVTPALSCGVLDGVVRGRVLAAAAAMGWEVEEAAAGPDRLAAGTGIFLTNSLIGIRPASRLDGRAVAASPRLAALAAAFA